ncbi:SGNH/GDSL hydrolase family protein [Streptomyces mayteni]
MSRFARRASLLCCALLRRDLRNAGYTSVDFVGTQALRAAASPTTTTTRATAASSPPPWPTRTSCRPGSPATILAAFGRLVGQLRANNPEVTVLVARILPMNAANHAECGQRVVDLDAAIPGWAAGMSTAQSPVVAVDQWTGFNPATDTCDGVHPNDAGNVKLAARWYPALVRSLG